MEGDWIFLTASEKHLFMPSEVLWLLPFSVQGTWRECIFPMWVSINLFLVTPLSVEKFQFVKLYNFFFFLGKIGFAGFGPGHHTLIKFMNIFGLLLFNTVIHLPPSWLEMWYLHRVKTPVCEVHHLLKHTIQVLTGNKLNFCCYQDD